MRNRLSSAAARLQGPRRRLAGVACSALLAVACQDKGQATQAKAPTPVPVTVATVVKKDMPVEIRVVGTAEPVSTVQIMPQVSGVVQEVHFHEGDFVKKGALLFSIDTRPYQATLSAAQAELEKSRALAEQAHQEVSRYEKLAAEGLTSQLELAQRRANAAALDATLTANRAAIQTNSINVQFATLRAPIDGRTGSLLVQAGNVVRPTDARPLVVIRTLSPIFVRFAAPEQYLASVRNELRAGAIAVEARPRGSDGATATGELTFIENTVDPATGRIDMKGRFGNDDQLLWPGQLVDVVVHLGREPDAIVVPEASVQTAQDGSYTFVVGPNDVASLRKIQVERTIAGETVVTRGLEPGERVVTDGQVRLRQGTPVQIKAPMAARLAPSGTAAADAPGADPAHRAEVPRQ